jgi:glycosyltransferase involved in cell wall biosynthesis
LETPADIDFSIIIPTYNRPDALAKCLEHLDQLNYDSNRVEILVVDDGSHVSYDRVLSRHPRVRWFQQSNGGPASARNLAARHASGRFLAFIDDDCYADPEWLQELMVALTHHRSALVGGSTPAFSHANIYDRVSQFITLLVYLHYNRDPQRSQFFASNNLAMSRELFEEVGGFCRTHTKNAAEDRTLCNTVLSLGHPIVWKKEAIVHHHPELNFRRFCGMYFRYGRGAFTYQKARKTGRMLTEAKFHLELPKLIRLGLREQPDLPRIPTLALLGTWQVCNVVGFFWQSIQGSRF